MTFTSLRRFLTRGVISRRSPPEMKEIVFSWVVYAAGAAILSACSSSGPPAPVVDRGTAAPLFSKTHPVPTADAARPVPSERRGQVHTVQKGDTLAKIALDYGLDYKNLAEWNNLPYPYTIRIGQQLKLYSGNLAPTMSSPVTVTAPLRPSPTIDAIPIDSGNVVKNHPKAVKKPYSESALAQAKSDLPSNNVSNTVTKSEPPTLKAPAADNKVTPEKAPEKSGGAPAASGDDDLDWGWPASGPLISGEGGPNKGIDIAGKLGEPVYAAAPGKVVYSGSGLRGYGKLIIIKHNKTYLSAYAHNSQLLVKEGATVNKGQKIAEIGDSSADRVKLHFEIRRLGKPVDPLKYLPTEKSG